jgi:PPOX class probable F420-dependent enzyme
VRDDVAGKGLTPVTGPDAGPGARLDEKARELLDGRTMAVLATRRPDGAPQSSVVWVLRDGDALLFSSTARRQKVRNVAVDPRVSVSFFDPENPYLSYEIRGTAELLPDDERTLPRALSQKYLGTDPPREEPGEVRLVIRVTPDRVVRFAPEAGGES